MAAIRFTCRRRPSRMAALSSGLSVEAIGAVRLRRGDLRQHRGRFLHARATGADLATSSPSAAAACWCSARDRSIARAWPARALEHALPVDLTDRRGDHRAGRRRSVTDGEPQHAGADHRWRDASGDAAGGDPGRESPEVGGAAGAGLGGARSAAPRPGAQVLAVALTAGGTPQPLIAAQRYGQGRSMVFAGEASWRWRMMRPATDTATKPSGGSWRAGSRPARRGR